MKKVLLSGATGFIGSHVLHELVKQGFEVSGLYRNKKKIPGAYENHKSVHWINAEFTDFLSWKKYIQEHDVLINAVGIIRETRRSKFKMLHQDIPSLMFEEAGAKKIKRVIQISALGVGLNLNQSGNSFKSVPYFQTKQKADKVLINSGVNYTIFRPSLVYTARSEALKLFTKLVSGPITPVIGDGLYSLQPIYVGDLARCVGASLKTFSRETKNSIFELGGPQVLTFHQLLDTLAKVVTFQGKVVTFQGNDNRSSKLRKFKVSAALMSFFTSLADLTPMFPILPLTKDQLTMLLFGSVVKDKKYLDVFKFSFTKLAEGLQKNPEF